MFKALTNLFRRRAAEQTRPQVGAVTLSSPTLDQLIGTLRPEDRDAAEELVPEIAEGLVDQWQRNLVRERNERLRDAAAKAEGAEAEAKEALKARDEARQVAYLAEPGAPIQGIAFLICCLIGVTASLALNLGTIPFLLDTSPRSLLGIALAAAPTTAVLILDVIFERALEGPFRRRRLMTPSRRGLVWVAMALHLIAAALLIFANVWLYSEAREQAITGIVNHTLLRHTILALSFLETISAAWFCTLGTAELRTWWKRRQAKDSADQAVAAAATAGKAAREASTVAENRRAEAGDGEKDADAAARVFQAEVQLRLAMQLQAHPAPPTVEPEADIEAIVAQALRRRIAKHVGVNGVTGMRSGRDPDRSTAGSMGGPKPAAA